MKKWFAAPMVAAVMVVSGSLVMAQEPGAVPPAERPPSGSAPQVRESLRREGGSRGQMTTAGLERQFARRITAWETAKIPADKVEKAKGLQEKMKEAFGSGSREEMRDLNRQIQDLLTPEEQEAVRAQMRPVGRRDGQTTGGAVRRSDRATTKPLERDTQ
jgi:hypothetical protein